MAEARPFTLLGHELALLDVRLIFKGPLESWSSSESHNPMKDLEICMRYALNARGERPSTCPAVVQGAVEQHRTWKLRKQVRKGASKLETRVTRLLLFPSPWAASGGTDAGNRAQGLNWGAAGPYLMNSCHSCHSRHSCHSCHSCHARAQSADTVLSAEAAGVWRGIVRSLAELSCHALRLSALQGYLQNTCGVCGVSRMNSFCSFQLLRNT